MGRWCRRLMLLGLCAITLGAARVEAADVLAAASDRHVFVVRRAVESDGWQVLHFDATASPSLHRTVFQTQRRPEAIAASGDRCLLVLAPVDAARPVRLGVSFRVAQHPFNHVWYADPPGEPRVMPPLPDGGDLGGLVAAGLERLLVFTPSQRSARGVSRVTDGDASPPVSTEEAGSLYRLDDPFAFDWLSQTAPVGFDKAIRVVAGTVASSVGDVPLLIWTDVAEAWHIARLDADGWRVWPLDGVGSGEPVSIASLGDRTLLAVRDERGLRLVDVLLGDEDRLRVRGFTTLGPDVAGPDAIAVGTAGGAWVIGLDGTAVQVTTVDRVDGTATGPTVASEIDVGGSLVEFPIYATLMFSVMFGAFLLRPHIERQPGIPVEGLVPAGLLRRAAGLCIDLTPGMMAAVLVFDLDPAAFLKDVQSGDPAAVTPALFGAAVASAITVVFEVVIGRSIGKLLVGCRVVALDGTPGTPLQRGLRAGLRFVVLMFWPIGVLAVVEPLGRGMPELLSRTVVVAAKASAAAGSSEGSSPAEG